MRAESSGYSGLEQRDVAGNPAGVSDDIANGPSVDVWDRVREVGRVGGEQASGLFGNLGEVTIT